MVGTIHETDEFIKEVMNETTEGETRMVIAGEETNGAEDSTMKNMKTREEDITPDRVPTIKKRHEGGKRKKK
jgi:hypothetical protein